MKFKKIIVGLVLFWILLISFSIAEIGVVSGENVTSDDGLEITGISEVTEVNEIIGITEITKEDAAQEIKNAYNSIQEMELAGLSTQAVIDLHEEAEKAFERAEFAELINMDAGGEIGAAAKAALEGLNYEGFSYADVFVFTEQISERKKKAFSLMDYIGALEIKINLYSQEYVDTSEAEDLLLQAKEEFDLERYTSAEELLLQADDTLEDARVGLTTVNVIVRASSSFFVKYWWEVLILLAILIPSIVFTWYRIRRKIWISKLEKLRLETKSLVELIKRAQKQRFEDGNLAEMVYNIRMEKYNNKLNEAKSLIPVYEAKLRKSKPKNKLVKSSVKKSIKKPVKRKVNRKTKKTKRISRKNNKKSLKRKKK